MLYFVREADLPSLSVKGRFTMKWMPPVKLASSCSWFSFLVAELQKQLSQEHKEEPLHLTSPAEKIVWLKNSCCSVIDFESLDNFNNKNIFFS